jgi:hypothetical protein
MYYLDLARGDRPHLDGAATGRPQDPEYAAEGAVRRLEEPLVVHIRHENLAAAGGKATYGGEGVLLDQPLLDGPVEDALHGDDRGPLAGVAPTLVLVDPCLATRVWTCFSTPVHVV